MPTLVNNADAFMVSIEAEDAHFDKEKTRQFLESIGGKNIEYLESDEEQSKD